MRMVIGRPIIHTSHLSMPQWCEMSQLTIHMPNGNWQNLRLTAFFLLASFSSPPILFFAVYASNYSF